MLGQKAWFDLCDEFGRQFLTGFAEARHGHCFLRGDEDKVHARGGSGFAGAAEIGWIGGEQLMIVQEAFVEPVLAIRADERVPRNGLESRSEAEGDGTRYTARARHWTPESKAHHLEMGFLEGWGVCADQLQALCEA